MQVRMLGKNKQCGIGTHGVSSHLKKLITSCCTSEPTNLSKYHGTTGLTSKNDVRFCMRCAFRNFLMT